MKNKKVFFVMSKLGGKGWGGAHRVSAILANNFAKKGYDVTIIVWNVEQIDYPIDNKVKIIDLKIPINNELDRIKACFKTRSILKKHKGSYVYILMSRMAIDIYLSTLFLNLKIIGSERTDPNSEPKKEIFRKLRNILFCFLYKTVYQTDDAKAYFPKKAQKNGYVIPNPISHNLPKAYTGKRKKEFVAFCRIDKQKNLPMMIDAFIKVHQKHPDYILRIYGSGLIETEIKQYIKDKKADKFIKMEGFCNSVHEKIIDSYAFLSSSDYEGMSNSMLEAMAIGLPCICTDCPIGGAKMVIKNKINGILIPVDSTEKMIEAINELIEDKKLCEKLSHNAQKIRDDLSEKNICLQWEKLMLEERK